MTTKKNTLPINTVLINTVLNTALCLLISSTTIPAWAEDKALTRDKTLARFFEGPQRESAQKYIDATRSVPDADAVSALYRHAIALENDLLDPINEANSSGIWPKLEEFTNADLMLPGVGSGCVAECTYPALVLDVDFFKTTAATTAEKVDDAFFALLEEAYGPQVAIADGRVVSYPNFFERTWDYGGHSLLGSGAHQAVFERMDALGSNNPLAKEVGEIRETLMRDVLETSQCNGLPASKAAAEIGRILESATLDDEERRALTQRRAAFLDPTAYGIQTSCRDLSNCTCNTG